MAVSLGHTVTDWFPNSLFIILPYLATDLGLTYSQVGVLMGWNYFTSFFVNLPGGLIVDVVGKTGLLLGLAVALTGLPYALLGFSTTYATAILCVTFVGIGSNLWHPAALSFLARRYPDRKGLAMALHTMGGNVGSGCAPLAIGSGSFTAGDDPEISSGWGGAEIPFKKQTGFPCAAFSNLGVG